jgi:hypothetical protein
MANPKNSLAARTALFASVCASGRLASPHCTVPQLQAFYDLLARNGGSITGSDFEDLLLLAVYYSRVCASYEATEWVGFDLLPGWESDVLALVQDESAWLEAREQGLVGAAALRAVRSGPRLSEVNG